MVRIGSLGLGVCTAVVLGHSSVAWADDPFSAKITVFGACSDDVTCAGQTASVSLSNAEDEIDFFKTAKLMAKLPAYNDNAIAFANVDFQRLLFQLAFPTHGTTLTFVVPSLHINQAFNGQTRNDSVSELLDFLKGNGGSILNEIQHALVADSPVSPIAGNPTSLQSRLVDGGFGNDAFNPDNNPVHLSGGARDSSNRFALDFAGGSFSSGGISGQSINAQPGWTFRYRDSDYQLNIAVPITYTSVGGAKGGNIGFTAGFQFPVARNWYITPRVFYGAALSVDLAAAAQLAGATVTSRYVYKLPTTIMGNHPTLTFGDMLGYTASLGLNAGGYHVDPGIHNVVTKNGLMIELPLDYRLLTRRMSIQTSYAYTQYFGTQLFVSGYHDVGFSVGTRSGGTPSFLSMLRLGLNVQFGHHYSGISGNFGYVF
jgi:hypothetical protein